jgi:thiamine kinase-like enzyme
VYSQVRASFLPEILAWDDDGQVPLLVLEDLSDAFWPPPWTFQSVHALLETLESIHHQTVTVRPIEPGWKHIRREASWHAVAESPKEFLSLRLCSDRWLDRSLPRLLHAADGVKLSGTDFVHLDVRSDNVCFSQDRVVLIDWNWATRANGDLDIAIWLPSLAAEGGPEPDRILPDAPEFAAFISGMLASWAGLPASTSAAPNPQRVRKVQLQQLLMALPWAIRALELPPLDGYGPDRQGQRS